jgi:hypothetical protein
VLDDRLGQEFTFRPAEALREAARDDVPGATSTFTISQARISMSRSDSGGRSGSRRPALRAA